MADQPAPPAPVSNAGLAAKRILLRRNGATDDEIATIETVVDADLLLEELRRSNKPADKPAPKPGVFLAPNLGQPGTPKPEDMSLHANASPRTARLANPLSVEGNLGLRFNSMARLLEIHTDNHPDGRVF